MKKILRILLVLICCFALTGCGSDKKNDDTDSNEESKNVVDYITDRMVKYDSDTKQYVVFFGLKNSLNEYVTSTGTVTIVIKDVEENILYDKEINFDSEDFVGETNGNSSKKLCRIYINKSDIKNDGKDLEKLSLAVKLDDDTYFGAINLGV